MLRPEVFEAMFDIRQSVHVLRAKYDDGGQLFPVAVS